MSFYDTSSTVEEHISSEVALHVQSQLIQFFSPWKKRILILAGPTGVGKTDLSLKIAKKIGGEIVSCDSMQVYRGMDIGTAKVSFEERQLIPHHLIDIRDVDESFHVFDYFQAAKAAIESIIDKGKVPIIVGGTGFYMHALLYGPPQGPAANKDIRKKLEEEQKTCGLPSLYERVVALDPTYAKTITPSDVNKIVRALEIMELSGKKVSDFQWGERAPLSLYDFRAWFLYMPREQLYRRLDDRCEEMIDAGLIDEVIELDRKGIRKNSTASRAIGYRQTLEYLDSAKTEEEYDKFVERLKIATRQLAKRQYTWFRKESLFRWVDIAALPEEKLIDWIIDDFTS